jgi:signal transduction histidine kinase
VGRLFWKVFLCNWLAQLVALFCGFVWLRGHLRPLPAPTTLPGLFGVVAASFVSAALLAWYLAKPIRSLRSALTAAAAGDFGVKLAPAMVRRRDELADLGQHFDQMTSRLRQLLEGQLRLLHDVSHQLRSPLARMQAAIGLARQQPERLDVHLKRIELEAVRMDALVEELLTLARLQAGVGIVLDEDICLPELLAALVEDCDFEARASGGQVQLDADSIPIVRGNSELLHRAIENVVRNAIKHGGADRKVAVKLSCGQHGGYARVIVLDSGPGVSETQLETIFEPFVSADATGRSRSSGHGLGLTIARRIIAAHGGRIRASNRHEGGLMVDIELPIVARGSISQAVAQSLPA